MIVGVARNQPQYVLHTSVFVHTWSDIPLEEKYINLNCGKFNVIYFNYFVSVWLKASARLKAIKKKKYTLITNKFARHSTSWYNQWWMNRASHRSQLVPANYYFALSLGSLSAQLSLISHNCHTLLFTSHVKSCLKSCFKCIVDSLMINQIYDESWMSGA